VRRGKEKEEKEEASEGRSRRVMERGWGRGGKE
jgi:hypothetical protein